jgi:two-component system, OmpR family, response regulator AdeR
MSVPTPTPSAPVVLISDDDPLVVRALARAAQRAGMMPICDLSSQVERLAARYKPRVILMDIQQHVDGMELLYRLKTNPQTALIKVVMMSGIPTTLEGILKRRDCIDRGATEFMLKPLDVDFMNRLARTVRG